MTLDDIQPIGQAGQNDLYALQDENQYLREELEYMKQAMAGQSRASAGPQSADERFADRMLKQRIPKDEIPKGANLWLLHSDFIELIALIPSLSAKDYRAFVRDWDDIETLAQGGGNKQIVKSRMERLVFRIQLYRSRGDNPISGMTERTALITHNQNIDQRINTPQPQRQGKGFVEGILSRFR